jgi:methionyl-tRNA formyltransferase
MQNKRIVFAGGTDWSVDFLEALVKEGFNVVGVLTLPDSPKDRGLKVAENIIKSEGDKLKIPVFQPRKLNNLDFLREFKKIKPDMVVAVAYGKLFPRKMLSIPPLGFVNFHPSLLPKLRGPSPIMGAILEGFTETGVSIIKLGEGMDDGPILVQKSRAIDPRETNATLTRKLVNLGKRILPKILKKYINGEIVLSPQPKEGVTVCGMVKKEDGRVDWQNETAEQIDRKIRALNPQFKTFTFLERNNQKKRVNILDSFGVFAEGGFDLSPGQYKLSQDKLAVGTSKNTLLINKIQLEGKKAVFPDEFIWGYGKGRFLS